MERNSRIYFAIATLDGIIRRVGWFDWWFLRWLFSLLLCARLLYAMISICNYDFLPSFQQLYLKNTTFFVSCFIPLLTAKQSFKLIRKYRGNGEDKAIKHSGEVATCPGTGCRLLYGKMFYCGNQQQTGWAKPLSQSELGKKVQKSKWIQVFFLFFCTNVCFIFFFCHLVTSTSFTRRIPKCFFISQMTEIYRAVLMRKGWKRHFPIL